MISFPKVRVTVSGAIGERDALPQLLTSRRTARADEVGDDLSRRATQHDPDPTFVGFFLHK